MKSKKILMTLVGCLLASVMFAGSAHAGGWLGSGSVGGSGSGSGGGGGGCSGSNAMYHLDCTGYSWMYFKYNGGYDGDITLPMNINSSSVYISGECAEVGGFYHFGRNAQGRSYGGFTDYENVKGLGVESRSPYTYKTSAGSWGHMQTYTWGHATGISWAGYKTHSPVRQDIYRGNTVIYKGESIVSENKALADFKEAYLAVNGKEYKGSSFPDNLYAFCYGPDMGKKEATYTGRVTATGDSGTVTKDTFTVTFTHSLKRTDNNYKYDPANHWYTEVEGGGTSRSGDHHAANAGWRDVRTDTVTGSIGPGETIVVCQVLHYKSSISESGSTDAETEKCVEVKRGNASASGLVDAMVSTDTASNVLNPSSAVKSNNGNYTVKFRHKIKRNDSNGGTVSVSWNTTASGSSNRGGIADGTGRNHSGTTSLGSGQKTVVDFNNEVITGTLFPGESRTFCQTLNYSYKVRVFDHYRYTKKGRRIPVYRWDTITGNSTRCATVSRDANVKCDIDNSYYGIENGTNTARMKFMNISNSQSKTLVSNGEDFIWAKPTDRIRYEYDICAGGQLHDDYYHWGDSSYNSRYLFTGGNTTSSNPNKYLFPSDLGNGNQPYTVLIGFNTSSWGSEDDYEKSFASPTVTYLGCPSSNPGQYYQIPDHNSLNCRTKNYVGRNSDAGSIISQTLTYPRKPNSGNNALVGQVKVPYNYDLVTTPLNTNPKNVPINAGTTFDIGFKVDVTPRCNVQVQGNCNSTDKEYKTFPKTTQYRIYSWAVNSSTSETQLKHNIGTEIKDKSGNVIGYYLSNDPARLGYTINKSGSDLFGTDGNTVIVTTSDGNKISVPANTAIGTKICAAVAVWPADSHDLPGSGTINDSSQSAALKNSSNLRQWRSSKPSCYTVGKKPSISVKNGGVYAEGGIKASTSYRMINSTYYLFGSWSEYTAASSKNIIGFSTGAGLWGGTMNGDVAGKECRYSSMTLANSDCSSKNLGNIRLGNTASSPKHILDQIMTRYTSTETPDLGNANVDIQGACRYDNKTGTYIKQSSSSDSNYTCLHNGSAYAYSSGTLTINPDTFGPNSYASWLIPFSVDNYSSRTYVIHAKDIIVNESIVYGSAAYEKNPVGHSMTTFNSAASVPQVILIAENSIQIGASVVNLDAWLIAPEINTCSHDEYGRKFSTTVGSGKYNIDSHTCNRQLVINGPVFTKKLKLNRTHGGGGDTKYISRSSARLSVTNYDNNSKFGAASPAETFNISPEVYLWSFHQATRFSQATTTYQREMPIRY